ncbi:MAG: oligosaccharide flippase family protein [Erysipelotrichaceae bacterium]
MFNTLVPIMTGMYVSRIFSLTAYGVFNSANADLSIFLIFASFGIYNYGIREIGRAQNNSEKKSEIFSSLFVISIISNVLVVGVFVIYVVFAVDAQFIALYLVLVINFIANAFNIEWVNEGLENYKFITMKTVIIRSIYVIALFIFVKDSNDVVLYTFLLSMSLLINNLVSFIFVKKNIEFSFKKVSIIKHIGPLVVMMLIININYLYGQLDKVVISKFGSYVDVSFYHIPNYIVNTIFVLLSSIIVVSIPKLSFFSGKNEPAYENILEKTTSVYFLFAIPVFLGMASLAENIMIIYGGVQYGPAYPVLIGASLYKIIASFEYIYGHQVMYIKNKHNDLMKLFLLGGIINCIGLFVLVNTNCLSPLNATIVTLIAESVVVASLYIYSRIKLKLKVKIFSKTVLKYILICLLFIPICYIVRQMIDSVIISSIVGIILCSTYYFIVLYLMKDQCFLNLIEKIFDIVRRRK